MVWKYLPLPLLSFLFLSLVCGDSVFLRCGVMKFSCFFPFSRDDWRLRGLSGGFGSKLESSAREDEESARECVTILDLHLQDRKVDRESIRDGIWSIGRLRFSVSSRRIEVRSKDKKGEMGKKGKSKAKIENEGGKGKRKDSQNEK